MANKLKNLKITKVDFVDDGANQGADVKLYKRNSNKGSDTVVPIPVILEEAKTHSTVKRIVSAIGKALGFEDEVEVFQGCEDIQKGNSQTFGDKMTEVKRGKVADEMWSICYALQSSLQSILYDEDLDEATAKSMMEQSIKDFNEIIADSVNDWSSGKLCGIKKSIDETEVEVMKNYRNRLDSEIEAFEKRGELEDMLKIDKAKMTPEERAAYDQLIKKYAVETEDEIIEKGTVKPGENEEEMEDEKGTTSKPTKKSASSEAGGCSDDIYKGLHPAVIAVIESLKKRADDAEEREMEQLAKKYEILGKKPEELVPMLKSLRAADGTAYNDMIAIMDAAVATTESSGVFSEIGKSSHGTVGPVAKSASELKIEGIAKSYVEKDPALSYEDAVAKAWENNPDLMLAYEEENGF